MLDCISGPQREYFSELTDKISEGLALSKNFQQNELEKAKSNVSMNVSLKEVYQRFSKAIDCTISRIFRSFSEASAETVGSVMVLAIQRGRNTHPYNFDKEIRMPYNLPPLHILSEEFLPKMPHRLATEKEFFRRGDGNSRKSRGFKFTEMSAAIVNRKILAEKNTHVPSSFFLINSTKVP